MHAADQPTVVLEERWLPLAVFPGRTAGGFQKCCRQERAAGVVVHSLHQPAVVGHHRPGDAGAAAGQVVQPVYFTVDQRHAAPVAVSYAQDEIPPVVGESVDEALETIQCRHVFRLSPISPSYFLQQLPVKESFHFGLHGIPRLSS